jgi:NADPH-dependent curcumin reductase CurA
MSEPTVRQIVLASRPKGPPTPENFRLEEVPMPAMPPAGLLLRVLYLSLDPYMRGRMDDRKSYAKPVGIGEVMSGGVGCVVACLLGNNRILQLRLPRRRSPQRGGTENLDDDHVRS